MGFNISPTNQPTQIPQSSWQPTQIPSAVPSTFPSEISTTTSSFQPSFQPSVDSLIDTNDKVWKLIVTMALIGCIFLGAVVAIGRFRNYMGWGSPQDQETNRNNYQFSNLATEIPNRDVEASTSLPAIIEEEDNEVELESDELGINSNSPSSRIEKLISSKQLITEKRKVADEKENLFIKKEERDEGSSR